MTLFKGFDEAVIVDVETTGLDSKNNRIVSVALIHTNFGNLRENPNSLEGETMYALINPQCRIPKSATRIHGITNKDVSSKSTFSEEAPELREFIGNRPIIAHNVSFDKNFLNAEFKRAGVKTLSHNKSYCTMRRFQAFNQGRRKGSKLDDVVEVMGVGKRRRKIHNAIEDAELAMQVAGLFYMMDNQINDGNQRRKSISSLRVLATAIVVALLIWWLY